MLDRIQRWEQDDAVPHVISFEDPNHLKQIFSPHRIDIIRHLLNNSNVDIPELAKNLGQAVEETKDDIQLLEKYKIIFYREKDKNTKIYIPYENVKIENMWVLSSR
ncbi:hypothetical protein SAMN06264855_11715 [Halorubrum vacuolatum]|uniref:ArsR family transcriptional regulator n=2 Tax=Halorubrum vacuolatum TaxID=63740 RepID=A0A238XGH6_HALVU|nr:hypothetical protein SAMN06264855_11715 [Halorubrum vacuolatum]